MAENNVRSKGFSAKDFLVKNMVVVILVALILGFGLGTAGKFFQANNLINLTTQMAINAMLSAGLTYSHHTGRHPRLSVGSVAALAGIISTLIASQIRTCRTVVVPILVIHSGGGRHLRRLQWLHDHEVQRRSHDRDPGHADHQPAACASYSAVPRCPAIQAYGLGKGGCFDHRGQPQGLIPDITISSHHLSGHRAYLLTKTVFGRYMYAAGSNRK